MLDDDIRRISILVNDLGDGRDGDSWDRCRAVLEAAGGLTANDKAWLATRVDRYIAEYVPIIDGMVCPGRARKDRFRALLAALPDPPKEK